MHCWPRLQRRLWAPRRNSKNLVDAVASADHAAAAALVKAGTDVNAATADGSTPLHLAVNKGDRELVQLLLKAGAKPDTPNRYGVRPIALAAENGDAMVLLMLLKAGASATAVQADGDLPITIAARTGAPDALKALMAHGASPNVANERGQTPLMWAAAANNGAAVALLLEAGAKVDARTVNAANKRKPAAGVDNQYIPARRLRRRPDLRHCSSPCAPGAWMRSASFSTPAPTSTTPCPMARAPWCWPPPMRAGTLPICSWIGEPIRTSPGLDGTHSIRQCESGGRTSGSVFRGRCRPVRSTTSRSSRR